MCKFHSAIVMRNGDILQNENLTSHEDLVRLFNINDTQANCDKFVRVEYAPEEYKDYPDIEKYRLNIDEETTPKWFEKHREYVTERMKDFVLKRIITSDRKILTGGIYIIKEGVTVDKVVAAEIYQNFGTVTNNYGTVTNNYGTVTYNYGTVTNNYGTVTNNFGTVTYNYGTVTNNYGTVTYNYGTVTNNYGTVTNNYGTVTNNFGTVTENYGTIITDKS